MRSLPHSRANPTAIDTTGTAVAIPDGSVAPFFPPTQVKIYVTGQAYVGFGKDTSVVAAATTNTVYQEAATEEVYDINFPPTTSMSYLFIYATGANIDARVSFFG